MIQEDVLLHIVRERMQEARRQAEHRRALRRGARPARRSLRVHVGLALIRLGHGLLGRASPLQGISIQPSEGLS